MKKILFAAAVLSLALLSGCTSTRPLVMGGEIGKSDGKLVTASVTSFNFLGFTPISQETSEQALTSLQGKCPSGHVTGITTLFKVSGAFFGNNEEVQVSGYCAD
jgi:hypothetical protein